MLLGIKLVQISLVLCYYSSDITEDTYQNNSAQDSESNNNWPIPLPIALKTSRADRKVEVG